MATLPLAFFLFLVLHIGTSKGFGDSYITSRCEATRVETYSRNIKGLLSSMARVAKEGKRSYYAANNTSDFRPHRRGVFYGAYLCRGDILPTECTSCVLNAIAQLRVQCRTSNMGVTWFETCMVRYSNHTFLGTVVEDDSIYKWSKRRMITHQKPYLNLAGSLLQNTSVQFYTQRDISTSTTKYFGYRFAPLRDSYVTVYTMAQYT
ncbi:plasmodesmata-located protein 5-like [Silene latifolia]|uniref:plasmodesmata-located protein 5-like n=1 Tax=Silene latifolia TaxID=37657 RepID=UPI003D782701